MPPWKMRPHSHVTALVFLCPEMWKCALISLERDTGISDLFSVDNIIIFGNKHCNIVIGYGWVLTGKTDPKNAHHLA